MRRRGGRVEVRHGHLAGRSAHYNPTARLACCNNPRSLRSEQTICPDCELGLRLHKAGRVQRVQCLGGSLERLRGLGSRWLRERMGEGASDA